MSAILSEHLVPYSAAILRNMRLIDSAPELATLASMTTPRTPITLDRPLATAKPWLVCGISRAQWFKLAASGRTPLPVRLGTRRPVYLITELEAWLKAGAPPRDQWHGTMREGGETP